MAGYVRNDTANNITDGNIINSADLDGEFDAIVAAFVNTTGHTHDGTAAEGAPITKIGPTQDVVASAVSLTPKTTDTVDLGSNSLKFKDIYNSGTAYLTTLDLTNALSVADGGTGATTLTGVVKGNGTSAFTAGNVSLSSEVTGTLPVANGGTGATTLTGVIKGNGTSAFTAGNVSLSSEVTGTLPVANGGTGATTLTGVIKGNGTSALTTGNVNLASEVTGTLPVANGGTNLTSFPALSLPVANTLDTLSALTATASQSIRVNSGGNAWEAYTPSTGDVVGPASAVSGNIATFDGTTGKLIQDGGKALPTGTIVGTSDTQTLTNKTLTDPAIIGTILEDVYTISDGAAFEIDPGNGSVQLITLGASRTPKATNFAAGEAVTLMVDDGSAYTITWSDATFGGSGVVWKTDGGNPPTLNTTGYTAIVLWKVSTQVYGARVGNA